MIDTHCHLSDPQFNRDLPEVLKRAKSVGVHKIINAGYDVKTSQEAVRIAENEPWLLPAVGIHPNELAADSLEQFQDIERLLKEKKIYAVGETGLDYYRNSSSREAQQELFRRHITVAREYCLPLLIHTRNSIDDTIGILEKEDFHCGVFHCYSGTFEQAKVILDMGFYLGFGGILTFSKRTREIFKKIPVDRILLETDAPFLSPVGYRGKRNEPAYIMETLKAAAQILEMAPSGLERILDNNAAVLFSLDE